MLLGLCVRARGAESVRTPPTRLNETTRGAVKKNSHRCSRDQRGSALLLTRDSRTGLFLASRSSRPDLVTGCCYCCCCCCSSWSSGLTGVSTWDLAVRRRRRDVPATRRSTEHWLSLSSMIHRFPPSDGGSFHHSPTSSVRLYISLSRRIPLVLTRHTTRRASPPILVVALPVHCSARLRKSALLHFRPASPRKEEKEREGSLSCSSRWPRRESSIAPADSKLVSRDSFLRALSLGSSKGRRRRV